MSQTPVTVTDEMVSGLRRQLGDGAVVELTAIIVFANFTTRPNVALASSPTDSRRRAGSSPWPSRPRPPAPYGRDRDHVGSPFVEHRGLLFTVAYEMLGSAADAEDVVQESWLRWAARNEQGGQAEVRDPRAILVRFVTRSHATGCAPCRGAGWTIGEWLPSRSHLARCRRGHRARRASRSRRSMVLETLGPDRVGGVRAARGLEMLNDEIGEAIGKSLAAVRQIAHRAKEHVAAGDPEWMSSAPSRRRRSSGPGGGAGRRHAGPARRARARRGDGCRRRRDAQAARKPIHGAGKVAAFSGPRSGSTSSSPAFRSRSTASPARGSTSRSTGRRPHSASSSRTA